MARVTTLGELAASIAHEVNQPLAAIVANGGACLHWLRRSTPDLGEAEASVRLMIDDGNRASAVIQRIRALSRNAGPQKARLDINDVINEVVLLIQREVQTHKASLRLNSVPRFPP